MTLENTNPRANRKSLTSGSGSITVPRAVSIAGGARLHFGFADPGGSLGRRFGSIGLAIEEPQYRIRFSRLSDQAQTSQTHVQATVQRLASFAARVIDHYGFDLAVDIEVESALSAHAGLGSGTQLALAAGVACSYLAGQPKDCYEIGALLGRGLRSSIGAAAFDRGGFIVDGGRAKGEAMAPVIVTLPFPQDWAIILISDSRHRGLSADTEVAAFDDLPAFASSASAEICRLLILQVLPALLARDIQSFATGISRIQEITGDYFAPHQGGSRFTSERVASVLQWLTANGACGQGQSSWGPTGYAFCATVKQAQQLVAQARRLDADCGVEFVLTRGRNSGVSIDLD